MNERIRMIREHYGLSLEKFAQKLNRSRTLVMNVEKNRCGVSDDMIDRVCRVFSINEEWLRYGRGPMVVSAPVDKATVGNRLKTIRKGMGLTQVQFAEKIGYTQSQVQGAETGKIRPSNEYLECVCREFLINEQWLFSGVGKKNAEQIRVDEEMIEWLNRNPQIILELRQRKAAEIINTGRSRRTTI